MKLKIFLSALAAVLVFIFSVFLSGGNPLLYIDFPSFLIVGVAPFLYQLLLFGFSNVKNAFSSPLKKDPSIGGLSKSLAFFKSYGKATWGFTVMVVGISFIAILANLTEPEKLGPNFAVAILTVLYAAMINLLVILPFGAAAKQRLSDMDYDV